MIPAFLEHVSHYRIPARFKSLDGIFLAGSQGEHHGDTLGEELATGGKKKLRKWNSITFKIEIGSFTTHPKRALFMSKKITLASPRVCASASVVHAP